MPKLYVIKRDGKVVDFNLSKISTAMEKAFKATDSLCVDDLLQLLSMRVVSTLSPIVKDDKIHVEDIQDCVEKVLCEAGFINVARAYIRYRHQHENIRNATGTLLDYKRVMDDYLKSLDWRVKENSTVNYSMGGLILSNSGAMTANYWLSEIYDKEIADAHRSAAIHIHDLSMLSGYCAGWSLRQLIQEGLGGVPSKITSAPAKHLSTLCNQMVNFLGILQNEWAGAQAFSSFDTYLAPFVKADNLSYKETKQAIQSFIYGVNTPSRWGCVPPDTEILTVAGFKRYDELTKGEPIYTWKDGVIEIQPLNEIVVKEHHGVMHSYRGRFYNQTVTPEHRMLVKRFNLDFNDCMIKRSYEIFDAKTPYSFPAMAKATDIPDVELTDDEIFLAAFTYTDGSICTRKDADGVERLKWVSIYKSPNRWGHDLLIETTRRMGLDPHVSEGHGAYGPVDAIKFYGDDARYIVDLVKDKYCIDDKFLHMSMRQSRIFLDTWMRIDGNAEKWMLQCDNETIVRQIQQIGVNAGLTSHIRYKSASHTTYVKLRQTSSVQPKIREAIPYDGIVWCPNVENGTAVFRNADGGIFFSGNSQAPFTNVTIDWVCPPDMKDMPAIVGGKEMDFTYGDCKKEMDMVNKAFIEIMIEGDANGRGFQYPIPTYSITRDFDWSDTENNRLLFEMTAKYGTPYFSNYINSDMEPSDVRSMCPLTDDTKILVKVDDSDPFIDEIANIYRNGQNGMSYAVMTPNGWCNGKPNKQPNSKVYAIKLSNGDTVSMGENHLQITRDNGTLSAKDLKVGMWIPFNKEYLSNDDLLTFGDVDDAYAYLAIGDIEEIDYKGDLYCFEVDSDDHIFMLANGMYTHNCRLRLDLRELRKKSGGFFGSGESTGSVGVVTINLPRIAYQAYNEQDFYERLDKLMDIAARSLKIKREVITKFLDAGLYPYTKRYLGTFANHFSTIGLVGMNEAGLNARWLRKDLTHEETQKFAKDVLNHMRERLSDYQEQYGDLYNLEATPAESTSYRFAKHDKQDFPDIITANEHGTPYYTNSSHLPVGYTKDIFSALDVQDELQTLYTSGTVFHAFLGEKLPNWEAAAKLVRKIAENYKLPYYTMSPTYSVCPDCGYITGEQYTCPKCGKKTEVYSRITGYYRPVQNWNDGKTQEFKDRQTYDVDNSVLTHQGPIEDKGFEEAVERAEESLKTDEPNCILFTTSTCPKCPTAKKILENAKIPYTLVVADKEPEKAKEYGIRQAPTLICKTIDGEKVTVSGLSEIKDFIHRLRKLAD